MDTYDNMVSVEVCITIGGDVDSDHDVGIFDTVIATGNYGDNW